MPKELKFGEVKPGEAKKPKPPKKDKKSFLKTKSGVITLTVFLVLLISAGAYFLMIKPQLDRVGLGRELDLQTTSAEFENQQKYFTQLKALKKNFEEIEREQLKTLSQALPINVSTPELLAQLETMARQSGVDLKRVNLTEVEEKGPSARQRIKQEVGAAAKTISKDVAEVLVQIDIAAFDYKSFKDFVNLLGSHRRILDVEAAFFQTDQEDQRITLKAYYLKQ